MGPVCRTSTPAPTACFNPRIHQPLSPLVHSALPPTLVRPPLLEYATSSFYTSGTPGFLSGMVPRPSGMRCGSVGSATDAGSVSEGRASDDVDPPYEPGGWVPVPDVVGRGANRATPHTGRTGHHPTEKTWRARRVKAGSGVFEEGRPHEGWGQG